MPTPRTGFKFTVAIRTGPDAGAVYQLLPPRVTIGRDPASNNVTLKDPKVSRNAAIIEFSPDEITILDLSGKGRVTVNGEYGERISLKGGDIIHIGDTEFAFVVEAMQLPAIPQAAGLPQHPHQPQQFHTGATHGPRAGTQARSVRVKPKKSNRGTFYFVVILIFGGMALAIYSGKVNKKLDKGLRSTGEIEKDIADTDARVTEAAKKRSFRTEEEKTRYEEAQRHYLEGFRDYQKGYFTRAIRSFETARAIDPEHQLARRYFRLAEKQRDESVTQLLLEGRRYREKQMFTRCSSAIEKAMVMMSNKDDLKYKEAESMKKECDVLQENRF